MSKTIAIIGAGNIEAFSHFINNPDVQIVVVTDENKTVELPPLPEISLKFERLRKPEFNINECIINQTPFESISKRHKKYKRK